MRETATISLCNAGRTVQSAQGPTTLQRHRRAKRKKCCLIVAECVHMSLEQTKDGCNDTENTGGPGNDHGVSCAGRSVAGARTSGAGSVFRVSLTSAGEGSLDRRGAASLALERVASRRNVARGQQSESTTDITQFRELNTANRLAHDIQTG